MAEVMKMSNGYEFAGLSTVGMRLVNEFQRHHPLQCAPSSHPDFRFIRLGSPTQNRLLQELAARVKAVDPEPISAVFQR
jgi:hypothetical protein